MKKVKKVKKKQEWWWRFNVGECPVCGADKSYRERVNGKKPKSIKKRYVYIDPAYCYDWCTE